MHFDRHEDSGFLTALHDLPGDDESFPAGRIVERLGARAYGPILIVAAALGALPPLPFLASLPGAVILVAALALLAGGDDPRLPGPLARIRISTAGWNRSLRSLDFFLSLLERPSLHRDGLKAGATRLVAVLLVPAASVYLLPLTTPVVPGLAVLGLGLSVSNRTIIWAGCAAMTAGSLFCLLSFHMTAAAALPAVG